MNRSEAMQEFNLIDESWIRAMTKDCKIKEVSIKEILLNSHEFAGLAGETKTQDFAIFRFLLAIMFTVISRYDIDGNSVVLEDENKDFMMNQWREIWDMGHIPSKPVENYLKQWHDRFWLFDDKYPFYQSTVVKAKKGTYLTSAKLIGTIFESNNKQRLFADRIEDGKVLSYPEAARWLLHLNSFDDIASKSPVTPKRPWVGHLSLIAVKGKSFFETILLNLPAGLDSERGVFHEKPSWENDNNIDEFNRLIPVPDNEAALLSLQSRRIMLNREADNVNGYYISGGDYFEDTELFDREYMTLWLAYKEKGGGKNAVLKFKPKVYTSAKKVWRDFGSVVGLKIDEEDSSTSKRPGIINWLENLRYDGIIDRSYMLNIVTAAVIYDYGQATSLPVKDTISDSLNFHVQLLGDSQKEYCRQIIMEIEKCEKAAYWVGILYKSLQVASGRADKDAKTELSGEADSKLQFYDDIDRPFRLWLASISSEEDINEACISIEKKLRNIAFNFGNSISRQADRQVIFSHREIPVFSPDSKKQNAAEYISKALNLYFAKIAKIFDKAGDLNGETDKGRSGI
ncbi:MAG: type I-E CRISPR-associated protein Cse1/CasA [Synergistaceae bacterium]|nr:type I-E CRISPR-associated protein Cse1/CasA [Synergistaceae bacterium]